MPQRRSRAPSLSRVLSALSLSVLTNSACGGDGEDGFIYYDCYDQPQSVDFERSTREDGALVDETGDVRCAEQRCGDAKRAAVDIVSGSVHVDGDFLVADLELVEFPREVPFNQSGVRNNALEYEWSVSIDATGDGFDDVQLALMHFKYDALEQDLKGDPLEFPQHDVWVYEGDQVVGGDAEPEVTRTKSGIRFRVALESYPVLEAVGEDTIVSFSTFRHGPDWRCEDSL